MKKLTSLLPVFTLVAAGAVMLIAAGCSNQTTTTPGAPAANAAATNSVSYTCPMHPDFVTNQPGNCPICGMKLVPKT